MTVLSQIHVETISTETTLRDKVLLSYEVFTLTSSIHALQKKLEGTSKALFGLLPCEDKVLFCFVFFLHPYTIKRTQKQGTILKVEIRLLKH